MLRERIALNIPGKVHNGTCLVCHPDQDPDQERRKKKKKKKNTSGRERDQRRDRDHRRHHDDRRYNDQRDNRRGAGSGQPYSADAFRGDDWVRSHSTPEIERQPGQPQSRRDLVQSLPSDIDSLDIQDEEYYEDNEPVEYEEVVEYNIFNEPVVVRKPKPRQKKRSGRRDGRRVDSSPPNSPKPTGRRDRRREGESPPNSPNYHSPRQQSHRHQQHEYRRATPQAPSPLNYEEKEEIQSPEDWEDYPTQQSPHSPHGQNYDHHHLPPPPRPPYAFNEGQNIPPVPALAPAESASQCSGWEEMDELEREIARRVFKRPETFVPGTTNVMQNAFLECPDRDRMDEISVMTPDTCFVGQQSVASIGVSRRTNLTAISEGLSSGASSGRKRSLQSHQIHEPAAVQDMESYLENSAPHLMTVRESVGTCTEIGEDAQAIDVVTQSLKRARGRQDTVDGESKIDNNENESDGKIDAISNDEKGGMEYQQPVPGPRRPIYRRATTDGSPASIVTLSRNASGLIPLSVSGGAPKRRSDGDVTPNTSTQREKEYGGDGSIKLCATSPPARHLQKSSLEAKVGLGVAV